MTAARYDVLALTLQLFAAAAPAQTITHSHAGFSVTCPKGWHARVHSDGDVDVTNFPDSKWIHSGQLPRGGASILISEFPPGTDAYADLMNKASAAHDVKSSRDPVRVEGTEVGYRVVMLAPEKDGHVYYVLLEYIEGENGAAYERALSSVVAGIAVDAARRTPSFSN